MSTSKPASTGNTEPLRDWLGAPWMLHVLFVGFGVATVIKLLVPETNFFLCLLSTLVYGFAIYFASRLAGKLFPRLPIWAVFAVATPVGIAIGTFVGYFIIGPTHKLGPGHEAMPLWKYTLVSVLLSVGAVYLVYFRSKLLCALNELQQAQLQRSNQEKLLAESRLHALQSQIEPHFVFNTLANVQALIDTDPKAARRMLESFTRLLRQTLRRGRNGDATLGDELDVVQEYLSIQQQRLGRRLAFRIDVPPTLRVLPFPSLLLQPLVENAVKHGIEPTVAGGEVALEAALEQDKLVLRVRDTGQGFVAQQTSGIGLPNVRERLANLYGEVASLTLTENRPRGVCATVELPRAA